MDCGGGSDFGGGHSSFGGGGCSSSGADFGGSDFGGMGTSHNAHFTSTTHSIFSSHPTTTQWTSTTVSGPRVQSTTTSNPCGLIFLVVFFIGWFGVAGFMAYMAATNISPFLALPPICIALLGFFCVGCSIYQNLKRQRASGTGTNVNQHTTTTTQSHVHPPPQQGVPPQSGYPSSYQTSPQPQWNPAYSTNYGQQQYGMSGQQVPRPTAPPSGIPEEDKPPSYDDVVKGGTAPLGFV